MRSSCCCSELAFATPGLIPNARERWCIGKWLEMLREVRPRLARVAILWDPGTGPTQLHAVEAAARVLGIESRTIRLRDARDIEPAFADVSARRLEALVMLSSPTAWAQRTSLADGAIRKRLASISLFSEYADAGGLIAYGPSLPDMFRGVAILVDRIARGARPADRPVERPTRFRLVVNNRTAKVLGLTIPPSLLLRADQLIE